MPLRVHCRLIALMTAMLFGLSIVGHGFAMSGAAMNPMTAGMSSTGMSSPDHAMDCDGDDGAKQVACFATCASVIGILGDAAPVPLAATSREMTAPAVLALADHGSPPDPYPPKTTVLI
jgi:hypothetical protein